MSEKDKRGVPGPDGAGSGEPGRDFTGEGEGPLNQEWSVTVWGVRGSAPRLSAGCVEYGGNTACISLEYGDRAVVLDAGTGLSPLGQALAGRREIRRLDILLSHLHMDHVLGLFSFRPLFDSGMDIHIYGAAGLARGLEALIGPPYWPLRLGDFPARPAFHELQPGDSFGLDGLEVSTMAGNHPGGSILYRLDGGGKSLTYALDCEADGQTFPALTRFARGSGLLIWDASFTAADLRPGWGHSTWEQGLELGRAAGAGQVLMTHYSWEYTDAFLRRQEELACRDGLCRFAREGMVIVL